MNLQLKSDDSKLSRTATRKFSCFELKSTINHCVLSYLNKMKLALCARDREIMAGTNKRRLRDKTSQAAKDLLLQLPSRLYYCLSQKPDVPYSDDHH